MEGSVYAGARASLLKPRLRDNAVVLADNIYTFKKALGPFVDYMQSGKNGFISATLSVSDGVEFSIRKR